MTAKPARLQVLRDLVWDSGLDVVASSPGDGVRRYRFIPKGQYTHSGYFTAVGYQQAYAFAHGIMVRQMMFYEESDDGRSQTD